ncbi:MAG: tRNA adenosine(34) deaminase TadA [Veillonellaceae bacterium]|nr:tRNA adenosine(34) deaminase TadA [Veillonellaceae bacterium]
MTDSDYMRQALAEAEQAYACGEIPIGAVIVCDGVVVGRGHNLRERLPDATAHAEILAIREACRRLNRWRLTGCTLYVTIEPCPMCAGAIVNSRLDRLVYGAGDAKGGGVESIFRIADHAALNHQVEIRAGVCEQECGDLMRNFFRERRKQQTEQLPDREE